MGWGAGRTSIDLQLEKKAQIQSNHIIIHQENLYFVLKAINGLNYKFTKNFVVWYYSLNNCYCGFLYVKEVFFYDIHV